MYVCVCMHTCQQLLHVVVLPAAGRNGMGTLFYCWGGTVSSVCVPHTTMKINAGCTSIIFVGFLSYVTCTCHCGRRFTQSRVRPLPHTHGSRASTQCTSRGRWPLVHRRAHCVLLTYTSICMLFHYSNCISCSLRTRQVIRFQDHTVIRSMTFGLVSKVHGGWSVGVGTVLHALPVCPISKSVRPGMLFNHAL
jgi:hypothetical protein